MGTGKLGSEMSANGETGLLERKRSVHYLIATLFIVVGLLCGAMVYLLYNGHRMTETYAPQIWAAMGIKFHLSIGHLWFEEILSGDRHEDIAVVSRHFSKAERHARNLLEGGVYKKGRVFPLADRHVRHNVEEMLVGIAEFRDISDQRYLAFEDALPGSDIDQKFDRVFSVLLQQAEGIETAIRDEINESLVEFYRSGVMLILSFLGLGGLVSTALYRLETQKLENLQALEIANRQISEQNEQLYALAHYDYLTGQPNRALFYDRLNQALLQARRTGQIFALLYVDLDEFKEVNDAHGHHVGDELLCRVTERLVKVVRESDSVARIGGDEFTVLLTNLVDGEQAGDAAKEVAGKVLEVLSSPFEVEGHELNVTASIGIALYPADGEDEHHLMQNADAAMYRAKAAGRNQFSSSAG
ncbi:MAG: GGDEF domain-containing protein [Candidatus Sedimenticola sp. 6PFRAG5]